MCATVRVTFVTYRYSGCWCRLSGRPVFHSPSFSLDSGSTTSPSTFPVSFCSKAAKFCGIIYFKLHFMAKLNQTLLNTQKMFEKNVALLPCNTVLFFYKMIVAQLFNKCYFLGFQRLNKHAAGWYEWNLPGADKSLARPGRKQTRKHVRDARFQQHRDANCDQVFFFPARQGAEGNWRHSNRNISLFPSWSS